jgi:hypothetical protein
VGRPSQQRPPRVTRVHQPRATWCPSPGCRGGGGAALGFEGVPAEPPHACRADPFSPSPLRTWCSDELPQRHFRLELEQILLAVPSQLYGLHVCGQLHLLRYWARAAQRRLRCASHPRPDGPLASGVRRCMRCPTDVAPGPRRSWRPRTRMHACRSIVAGTPSESRAACAHCDPLACARSCHPLLQARGARPGSTQSETPPPARPAPRAAAPAPGRGRAPRARLATPSSTRPAVRTNDSRSPAAAPAARRPLFVLVPVAPCGVHATRGLCPHGPPPGARTKHGIPSCPQTQTPAVAHAPTLAASKCPDGFYADDAGCEACADACATCSSAFACTSCAPPAVLSGDTCTCALGSERPGKRTARAASASAVRGSSDRGRRAGSVGGACVPGPTYQACSRPRPAPALPNPPAACPIGFYANASNVCSPCPMNCTACTSATTCTLCDVGAKLVNGACQGAWAGAGCPARCSWEYEPRPCLCLHLSIHPLPRSAHCLCLLCPPLCPWLRPHRNPSVTLPALPSPLGPSPIPGPAGDCPAGTFEDAEGDCSPCATGCAACTALDTCTACSGSRVLAGGACVSTCPAGSYANNATGACSACPTSCSECDSPTQCLSCKGGFALFAGQCGARRGRAQGLPRGGRGRPRAGRQRSACPRAPCISRRWPDDSGASGWPRSLYNWPLSFPPCSRVGVPRWLLPRAQQGLRQVPRELHLVLLRDHLLGVLQRHRAVQRLQLRGGLPGVGVVPRRRGPRLRALRRRLRCMHLGDRVRPMLRWAAGQRVRLRRELSRR